MPTYQYRILPEYVGGFGRVSFTGITKLLQRAATEHSDDVGYPSSWYRNNNRAWMARRHRISISGTVRPEETVSIDTEVEDFRKIRSLRTYTMSRTSDDQTVVTGYTDWVYLDRESHSLCRIPDEMAASFDPIYETESPNRKDFTSPDVADPWHRETYSVQFRDLDELAHVNNAVYTEYLLETLLNKRETVDDFTLTELTIQYVGQATWRDSITCSIELDGPLDDKNNFSFVIYNGDDRIVEGIGQWTE